MEIKRAETVIPRPCITLKGHPRRISIIKPTNYMETLAVPSLRLGRRRLGGFDIAPVATFPIVLSCVCVRLRRDGRRFLNSTMMFVLWWLAAKAQAAGLAAQATDKKKTNANNQPGSVLFVHRQLSFLISHEMK